MSTQEIEKLMREAVLRHLSDEEIELYMERNVENSRIDAHINRCLICSKRVEQMREILEPVTETPLEDIINELVSKLKQGFQVWWEKHQPVFAQMPFSLGNDAKSVSYERGETEDGRIGWKFEADDETGEASIVIGSRNTEIEGWTVIFTFGSVRKEILLKRIPEENQLFGAAKFSPDEIKKFPANAEPQIDVQDPKIGA